MGRWRFAVEEKKGEKRGNGRESQFECWSENENAKRRVALPFHPSLPAKPIARDPERTHLHSQSSQAPTIDQVPTGQSVDPSRARRRVEQQRSQAGRTAEREVRVEVGFPSAFFEER